MKKKAHLTSLLTLITLILILSACNLPSTNQDDQVALDIVQTQVALTQTALASAGNEGAPPADTEAPPPGPTATDTLAPSPTITPSPTETLTPTQDHPVVSVSVNTNCRKGPGKQYEIIGALLVNETAEVVGKTADGQYWIVKNPNGAGECWLWGYYATVTGPTEALPLVTQPPTPTPQFLWEGSWSALNAPLEPSISIILDMNSTVNGKNFSAVMTVPGGDPVLLSGTISDDWLSVNGNWTHGANGGTFKFYSVGSDRFNGHSKNGETLKWCGVRGGGTMPDPCYRE